MGIKKIVHHTYQVYRTPNKRRSFRFTTKKQAQAFVAAIQDDNYVITLVPIQHKNFHYRGAKNVYAIQIVDKNEPDKIMYIQYYKLIVDKYDLQQPQNPVQEE